VNRRRRSDNSAVLLTYNGIQAVLGVVVFLSAVRLFPLEPDITLTRTGGREGILLGLVFWVVLGLLGSTRIERLHGHGVLTFHTPFIVAALALGGPVAGGIVAAVSTIERRELTEVPWYGTLANHAALTISSIIGGVVLVAARTALQPELSEPEAVELVAILAGGFTFTVLSTWLAVGTVVLRDRLSVREAVSIHDKSFRSSAASELLLGWVLAFTYLSVGWWAALVAATLVLVVWRGHDALEISRYDAMTGLLTRSGFDVCVSDAIKAATRQGRTAALVAIDLDRFKAINDTYGHDAGDAVLREVGARLQHAIRLTDAAVRRGGDEFSVLLAKVGDFDTAQRLALRIHERLCEPIELDHETVSVGASMGLYLIEPSDRMPSVGRLHDLADVLMYEAKRAGEPLRVARLQRREPVVTEGVGPGAPAVAAFVREPMARPEGFEPPTY
jgi:diguanylate cyclase (GGDEF)-like protein